MQLFESFAARVTCWQILYIKYINKPSLSFSILMFVKTDRSDFFGILHTDNVRYWWNLRGILRLIM